MGRGLAVGWNLGVGVSRGVALGVVLPVAVAVGVGLGVVVEVAVAVAVGVGLGGGVSDETGPVISTVIGEPVLKNPTVALVLSGG